MSTSKSHFRFTRNQRNGILSLIAVIIILQFLYFYTDFNKEKVLDVHSSEIVKLQQQVDSLKEIALQERRPKIFPFNPNFLTEYRGYTLGMSPEEIDRLHAYREKNLWINSVADFKAVTGVSDSLLNTFKDYFQFPDWVTNPKPRAGFQDRNQEKTFTQKLDLNKATAEELQKVFGVGEKLSQRIIDYRSRLNGFLIDEQLYDVYGLDPAVVKRIMADFTVKEKPEIRKININKASASDIATLPYISFSLAKEIVDYRLLHEGIKDFDELKNIEGFPIQKIDRITLYLTLN